MSYLPLPEAAIVMNVPARVLREMCECRAINGAIRFGRIWAIPEKICVGVEPYSRNEEVRFVN